MKQIALISIILLLISGCVKYDALPFGGESLDRATNYGDDWCYYNASTKKQFDIVEGEQIDRTDWDIAFNRYNIRTNSGSSGKGKGGAYDMGSQAYASITSVGQIPSDARFVTDTIYAITMSKEEATRKGLTWFDPNNGPLMIESTANPLLGEAIRFYAPPPLYTPSNHLYLIRNADGTRYYKLWIVSFYNQQGEAGKISFRCDALHNK